jgi:hypothetical protein
MSAAEKDVRGDAPPAGVTRIWRTVDAEGRVTGQWAERPPANSEAWARACMAEHYPEDRIEVQVTTVSEWMPDGYPCSAWCEPPQPPGWNCCRSNSPAEADR